jgi:hypothetical protein
MAAYVWRDYMRIGLGSVVLCWLVGLALDRTIFLGSAMMIAVLYSALWLAFVPKGTVLFYNRFGDYSYGVYIFAFPTQQTMLAIMPGQTALHNIALSLPISVMIAALSWHLIEKPSLSYSRRAGDWLWQLSRLDRKSPRRDQVID